MTTFIYYFSGTGNSLIVASDIVRELGDAEIFAIKRYTASEIDVSADRIGIVFPVYVWGLPLIVRDFVKRIKTADEKYIFAVATCGGSAGAALKQADKILKKNGLGLSAGFVIKMPGNYIPLYGAIPFEKQQKLFEAEKTRASEIAGIVRAWKISDVQTSNIFVNAVLSGILYKIVSKKIPSSGKNFTVDTDCNSCGLCAKICPVGNIELKSGKPPLSFGHLPLKKGEIERGSFGHLPPVKGKTKPVWKDHCQLCLACLEWCPEEAIQYGSKTAGRKRYHHPDIKAEDLI